MDEDLAKNTGAVPFTTEQMLSLYEKRIVVLMENDEEDGGGFSQIILTPAHFRKVSEAIMSGFPWSSSEDFRGLRTYDVSLDVTRRLPSNLFDDMKSSQ